MRIDKKSLKFRAMGISNYAYDTSDLATLEHKNRYSVQFYDYDFNGQKTIPKSDLERILEIFPYDCLMYSTKQGTHFISFALLYGQRITKSRAIQVSKALGKQDYWTTAKDLTLRVSPKWKQYRFSKLYKVISEKPIFKGLIKEPNRLRISSKHLEFYHRYMDLPDWVYNLYQNCIRFEFKIKVYHYKTTD